MTAGGNSLTKNIIAGVVIAAAMIVVALLWFRPWESASEYVQFEYRAFFTYLGSEDNEPLENLILGFPIPKIENSPAGDIKGTWMLYYIENDNTLTLQATKHGIVNLRGNRTSQLGIYSEGIENAEHGPTSSWNIDRLYPREVFLDVGFTSVPEERTRAASLRIHNESWSGAYWYNSKFYQENRGIYFSFVAELYRENTLVELFQANWEAEYGLYGWYILSSA